MMPNKKNQALHLYWCILLTTYNTKLRLSLSQNSLCCWKKVVLIIGREKWAGGPKAACHPRIFCNLWGDMSLWTYYSLLCCFSVWCLHSLSVVSVLVDTKGSQSSHPNQSYAAEVKPKHGWWKVDWWIQMDVSLIPTHTRNEELTQLSKTLKTLSLFIYPHVVSNQFNKNVSLRRKQVWNEKKVNFCVCLTLNKSSDGRWLTSLTQVLYRSIQYGSKIKTNNPYFC